MYLKSGWLRSKTLVHARGLPGIAISNPAGGLGCLSRVDIMRFQADVSCVGPITCAEESYIVWCV